MATNSSSSSRSTSTIDAKSIKVPSVSSSPEAQEKSLVVQHPAKPTGHRLLDVLWRSPDLCHQIGILDKQNLRFKNLAVDDAANAVAHAQKLSSEGKEVYFACAEYMTPDSRTSTNATGACAFWLDIDCDEDKAAAGKGYPTVEVAEDALRKFCKDTGLPKPTHNPGDTGHRSLYLPRETGVLCTSQVFSQRGLLNKLLYFGKAYTETIVQMTSRMPVDGLLTITDSDFLVFTQSGPEAAVQSVLISVFGVGPESTHSCHSAKKPGRQQRL